MHVIPKPSCLSFQKVQIRDVENFSYVKWEKNNKQRYLRSRRNDLGQIERTIAICFHHYKHCIYGVRKLTFGPKGMSNPNDLGWQYPCLFMNHVYDHFLFTLLFTVYQRMKASFTNALRAKFMTTSINAPFTKSVQVQTLRKENILLNITWRQQKWEQQTRKIVTEKFSAEGHTLYFSPFAIFTEKSMANLPQCDCGVTNSYSRLTSYYTSSFV
jgi:hypothetical protein